MYGFECWLFFVAALFSILAKMGLDVFFIAIIHCLIILAIVIFFVDIF